MVCFFVTYDLVRNKTGSVKGWDDRIVQKRQTNKKPHTQINIIKKQNVSRTCSFKILEGI